MLRNRSSSSPSYSTQNASIVGSVWVGVKLATVSVEPVSEGDVGRWGSISDSELFDDLMDRKIGDGLPVSRPTAVLIDELLRASGREGDESIGPFSPFPRRPSVYEIAICAALAGCRPRHMKVINAVTEAMTDPRLNLFGALTTTGSAAFAIAVNGPIRHSSGINAAGNCLGPGVHANAVIGRTFGFITRAVCGVVAPLLDVATMGQPGKYTFCFGENEEESPWTPLHAERGIRPSQSAVTVLAVTGTIETYTSHWSSPDDILDLLAQTLACPATVRLDLVEPVVGGGSPLLLLSPEWAKYLSDAGVTKARLKEELFERATCPWSRLPRSVFAAARGKFAPPALEKPLKIVSEPDQILVMVAGGVGIKQTVLPNWAGSQPVTIPID